MLAGPAGTGGTQMVQGLLNSFTDPAVYVSCNINFNFYDPQVLSTRWPPTEEDGHELRPAWQRVHLLRR